MDFKSIIVNGETYNVKDETARTQSSQALSKANTNESNITEIAGESLVVSYVSESESIQFTKGVVIGG